METDLAFHILSEGKILLLVKRCKSYFRKMGASRFQKMAAVLDDQPQWPC